jgi:hypothetical protein
MKKEFREESIAETGVFSLLRHRSPHPTLLQRVHRAALRALVGGGEVIGVRERALHSEIRDVTAAVMTGNEEGRCLIGPGECSEVRNLRMASLSFMIPHHIWA